MQLDQIFAQIAGSTIDLDAAIQLPTDNWELAILIGKTSSLLVNGYEDAFDAMDWTDAAEEVLISVHEGKILDTRRKLIKFVVEDCGFPLI